MHVQFNWLEMSVNSQTDSLDMSEPQTHEEAQAQSRRVWMGWIKLGAYSLSGRTQAGIG